MKRIFFVIFCFYSLNISAQSSTGKSVDSSVPSKPDPYNYFSTPSNPSTSLPDPNPTDKPSDEATNDKSCDEQLAKKIEDLMMKTDFNPLLATGVIQATEQGAHHITKDAKAIKETAGTLNGGLALAAGSKYLKCKSAISSCEEICDQNIDETNGKIQQCKGDPPSCSRLEAEKKNYESYLDACRAHKEPCDAIGFQAVVSGQQASNYFDAAKKLGGDPNSKEDLLSGPGALKPSQAAGGPRLPQCIGPNCLQRQGAKEFSLLSEESKNRDSSLTNDENAEQKAPFGSHSVSRGSFGNGLSKSSRPSSLSSISAGGLASKSISSNKEEENPKALPTFKASKKAFRKSSKFPQHFSSGQYQRSPKSKEAISQFGRSQNKIASLEKYKAKTLYQASSKISSKDSIFQKMSRRIQSYCFKGAIRC